MKTIKKINTAGRTIEEIRKETTKEPSMQINILDSIMGQINLDDVLNKEEGKR